MSDKLRLALDCAGSAMEQGFIRALIYEQGQKPNTFTLTPSEEERVDIIINRDTEYAA